ncbi:hypothetical protein FKM82_018075 [Ascaphus truei]
MALVTAGCHVASPFFPSMSAFESLASVGCGVTVESRRFCLASESSTRPGGSWGLGPGTPVGATWLSSAGCSGLEVKSFAFPVCALCSDTLGLTSMRGEDWATISGSRPASNTFLQ